MLDFFCQSREARKKLEQDRLRLYRIAFSWCHNAALADDLVQDTLTKAMRSSTQLRDPKAGNAWLYTILSNCYKDHFRRLRETEDIDNIDLLNEITPEHETSQQETVRTVRDAIAQLSENQRQVVTLVDLEGFSYVEVATILDIPVGTVMSRLCRARKTLRESLLVTLGEEYADTKVTRIRRIK
ncbi:MAG: sigma-70 family RNA polymerase sigma factor [Proteobacteria bacterium]|nr:sigma-70 family RNA polymerase sigma factor [Pseudomonadota bacterium]